MPIGRGVDWGERADVPDDAEVAPDDATARSIVEAARRADEATPPLLLTGGDLRRTLGGRRAEDDLRVDGATRVACDLGAVLIDGRLHWFVAHLRVGGHWLAGNAVIVCNAGHLGRWDISPRAHPGDGLLDLVEADLDPVQRVLAWRRLASGTHVPHPDISIRRAPGHQIDLGRARPIRLDGTAVGSGRQLTIRVEPASLDVYV